MIVTYARIQYHDSCTSAITYCSKNKQRTSYMLFDSSEFQLALDHK